MRRLCLVLGLVGCASASDVDRRERALLDATDPEKLGYCPAVEIARARTEVAIARAASERGEPVEAALHLAKAEELAALIATQATTCGQANPPVPEPPPPEAPNPDGDQDGLDDTLDPDDDGDGLSDVIDKCPREPEDLDAFEDLDGCPEQGP